MRSGKAVGIVLLHEHAKDIHELGEDRDLFYGSRIEEVQIVDLHESLENEIVDIRMCLRCNEKGLVKYLHEFFVVEETLKKIDVEEVDESDA